MEKLKETDSLIVCLRYLLHLSSTHALLALLIDEYGMHNYEIQYIILSILISLLLVPLACKCKTDDCFGDPLVRFSVDLSGFIFMSICILFVYTYNIDEFLWMKIIVILAVALDLFVLYPCIL
ncbi:MAG: hypothetical protein MHMPM18_000516 [Marteilia pararefringens]